MLKNYYLGLTLATFIILLLSLSAYGETVSLCPQVEVRSSERINFTKVERIWLCGDPNDPAWREVPLRQAAFFASNFLQARGYHQPEFQYQENKLIIEAGAPTTIKSWEVPIAPPVLQPQQRRRVIGRKMTPDTLDDLDGWAKFKLRSNGYPCPEVTIEAYPETSYVRLTALGGDLHYFDHIPTVGAIDLNPEILDRYNAYKPGSLYDIRKLSLSSSRIIADDLYISAYFDTTCHRDGKVVITRRLVPADPRLVTFGVGVDSEGLVLGRLRFRHSRVDDHASAFESTLFASLREQSLEAFFKIYFLDDLSSRFNIQPKVSIRREDEDNYRAISTSVNVLPTFGWETEIAQAQVQLGPGYDTIRIEEGLGPEKSYYVKWNTQLDLISHLFEYYMSEPREGWKVSAETSSRIAGVASDISSHRLFLRHHSLWNFRSLEPPLLIIGWRGQIGTLLADRKDQLEAEIPVNQKFFLGGDSDLRGFSRKQLPNDGSGYLSYVYQGFEVRTSVWLRWQLQPFVFADFAQVGTRSASLDEDLFWSPGIGLRWPSPLGPVRVSIARGERLRATPGAEDIPPHWKLFFSFGREF